MQLHQEETKPGVAGLVLLFGLLLMFLSFEAKASDLEDVSLKERVVALGPGSVIEFTDDLDFSLSREKRFCDGQDVGFFRNLMSSDCCIVRVSADEAPNSSQIVLKRGLRAVEMMSSSSKYVTVAAGYKTTLSCGDKLPTTAAIESSMGNRARIHKVMASPVAPAMTVEVTAEVSKASVTDLEAPVEAAPEDHSFKVDEI